jgi:hypothetical protein
MNKLFNVAAITVACLTVFGPVQAEGRHPRVREVNGRLGRQNRRINRGVKDGQLTTSQAQALRSSDKSIHQEEHTMRQADGGHLTTADKTSLNQQLNTNSQAIHSERTAGSTTGSTTGTTPGTTSSTTGTTSVWGNTP